MEARAPGQKAQRTPTTPGQTPPGPGEWRRSGSNRRPPACKAGALPAELRPHTDERRRAAPCAAPASRPNARLPSGGFLRSKAEPCSAKMGQGGLEPPTPRLSSVCSNQLSYWPAGPGFRPRPQKASRQPRPDAHRNNIDPNAALAGEGCADGADPPKETRCRPAAPINGQPGQDQKARGFEGMARPGPAPSGARPQAWNACGNRHAVRTGRSRGTDAPHPTTLSLKGGDPAAGSPTATLLRLHPSR